MSSRWTIAAAALAVVSGCGGGARQDVNEPTGRYQVAVTTARFPSTQRLSQHTHLVIAIRNASHKTIPDVAVTVCNVSCNAPAQPGSGTGTAAFSENIQTTGLANPSRPVWIVDRPPGPCQYSCRSGGPGAAVTAYSNTWALGRLRPGATATFDWGVTAIKPGRHVIEYAVAAGLNGKAKAVLSGGGRPSGTFSVTVLSKPQHSYVSNSGQIVNAP
ncbi:MAG: hypothetical protein ACR2JH_02550 [Solirubrobacteraceae bacterium]